MTSDVREMVNGYLDDTLSSAQQVALGEWIKADAEHARQFAAAVMLHDRLRSELADRRESLGDPLLRGSSLDGSSDELSIAERSTTIAARTWRRISAGMGVAAAVLLAVMLWRVESTASAAVAEVQRIIRAVEPSKDRTFRITVEESASSRRDQRDGPHEDRPPKPSLDNAALHVRGEQFVLIRQTDDGQPFVTGCDDRVSWAVRPDGPVRFSTDRTRFNRDVPGHEHSMPLSNLRDGLTQLLSAYDTQLLPVETQEDAAGDEATRLIVAVKKRGERGPRRVEISYAVQTGLIRQMRFIEMPYGPERLTLRMTLVAEQPLGENFFHHESHHDAGREVVEE